MSKEIIIEKLKTPKIHKEKGEVEVKVPEGPGGGTVRGMGAATKGGKFEGGFVRHPSDEIWDEDRPLKKEYY